MVRVQQKRRSGGTGSGAGAGSNMALRSAVAKRSSGGRDFVGDALTLSPLQTALDAVEASMANVGLVVALAPGADNRIEVDAAREKLHALAETLTSAARSLADDEALDEAPARAVPDTDSDSGDGGDSLDEALTASQTTGRAPRSSIWEQRTPADTRGLGDLASNDQALVDSYFKRRRWFARFQQRARLFFGVVPGHDDPELERFAIDDESCFLPSMISPTSNFRIVWDLNIAIWLIYIVLVEPLSLGFLERRATRWGTPLGVLNRIVDVVFLIDLAFNFRTGFVNRHKELVMDPAESRREYLRTWFPLDFVSSIPPVIEVVLVLATGGAGSFDPSAVALLRVLKIAKLLRLAKLMKFADRDSAFADSAEDFLASSSSMFAMRCWMMIMLSFLLAHLLACFMAASGHGWLATYDPDGNNSVGRNAGGYGRKPHKWHWWRQYVVAFYWAFTTMTSVGYGDVTPQNDTERIYAIFAMMIGVAFYSYIIATVASMVTAADAKSVIYFERMDQLSSWMRHYRFEMSLRRRTRRFFKQFYAVRSAIDERSILENLAPQLQEAVSSYLLHTFVKKHPLFRNLPEGTLWKVLTIVRTIQFEPAATIITIGSPSSALFVLRTGTCACQLPGPGQVTGPGAPRRTPLRTQLSGLHGLPDDDDGGGAAATPPAPVKGEELTVGPGASFGELCLLGTRSSSLVTVRTETPCEFFLVQRDAFLDSFANLPEILEGMIAKRTLFLKKPIRLPPKPKTLPRASLSKDKIRGPPRTASIRFVTDAPPNLPRPASLTARDLHSGSPEVSALRPAGSLTGTADPLRPAGSL